MLINASYLNSDSLAGYIAALEGGLREGGSFRSKGNQGVSGVFGINVAKIEGGKQKETEDSLSMKDHDLARLQRLITAGHENSDDLGWVEVLQPEADFPALRTGFFLEWECDIYIPNVISALSGKEGMSDLLRAFADVRPSADVLNLDTSGMPGSDEMKAMADFLESFNVSPVVVGDDSDTEWRVVGTLQPEWISSDSSFEGRVRVIGKVKKVIPEGRWYPLAALPGMDVMKREERRRLERQGPKHEAEKEQFLEGPLVVMDYLAIYI